MAEVKVAGLTPLMIEMLRLQEAGEKQFSVLCD